eukprot:UN4278
MSGTHPVARVLPYRVVAPYMLLARMFVDTRWRRRGHGVTKKRGLAREGLCEAGLGEPSSFCRRRMGTSAARSADGLRMLCELMPRP